MRLQNFLNEGRGKELSKEEALDFVLTKCTDSAVTTADHLYRGYEGPEYVLVDPTKFSERESPNAINNYYNLLLSNLPSWSKYPKRNKSIVASTNSKYASHYGDLYFVLPVDNTKMGLCPENDLWMSFGKSGVPILDDLNRILTNVVGDRIDNWRELKEALMQAYFDETEDFNYVQDLFEQHGCDVKIQPGKEINNWLDLVENILEPDRNGFDLINIRKSYPLNKEVWFDSPCILVREDEYDEFSKDFR